MDKPQNPILDDGSYYYQAFSTTIIGFCFLAYISVIMLIFTEASVKNLVLPMGSFSILLIFWMLINLVIGLVHKFRDRSAVNRFFQGEVWEQWQYQEFEWQNISDAVYKLMYPEDNGNPYIGAVYSSIFGLFFAVIIVLVFKFVVKEQEAMPLVWAIAVSLFLFMLGVGLLQPHYEQRKARRYLRKALRLTEPRIWFGPDGVYHETLGYTSLKEMIKVTDQTRSRNAITFKIETTVGFGQTTSSDTYSISFKVPHGFDQQAGQLVLRYRNERIRK